MTDLPFKFDEIGIWSELKLEIIEQYGAAYTKAFARTPKLKKYYIDGFQRCRRACREENARRRSRAARHVP